MTLEEIEQRAKEKAEKADTDTLINLFEGAVGAYAFHLDRNNFLEAERTYVRKEVYREEILKRLG